MNVAEAKYPRVNRTLIKGTINSHNDPYAVAYLNDDQEFVSVQTDATEAIALRSRNILNEHNEHHGHERRFVVVELFR